MKIHRLKTWPEEFDAMMAKLKMFDYRKNDRDFQVGDYLRLDEYFPDEKEKVGLTIFFKVVYILKDAPMEYGIPEGYCIMQLAEPSDEEFERLKRIAWPEKQKEKASEADIAESRKELLEMLEKKFEKEA